MAEATTIQTFLIADVRGYTLFTQERGDEAAAKLAAKFARTAREIVQRRGGNVIELRGDEALAVFSSARQAVLAAIDLQERMVEETLDDPELPLPVGIGLDAGEAVPVESGYRGGALNLAARLCGEAGPGEILASRSVTHLARRVEGVRYLDRGRVQLKNLTEPVEVVRIVPEGADPAERLRTTLPPARPPAKRPRRNVFIAAAVALALVVAATVVILSRNADPTIEAGAVGFLDPSGELQGTTAVGDLPRGLATGAGGVWAVDEESRTLLRVNPSTFRVEERIPVGAGPSGVTVAKGLVWVTNTDDRTVSVIDPEAHRVVQTIVVGNAPVGIAADGDRVWVTNSVDATVSEIRATDGKVIDEHAVGERPVAVAAGGGALWVANELSGTVSRVASGEGETQSIPVGRGPAAVTFASGSLWVANAEDGTVTRIDPATGSVTGTQRVGEEPLALASVGGDIWVADAGEGAVVTLDPGTMQVADVHQVGNEPQALTGTEDGVWVGVEASPLAHRGGTLRLASAEGISIDPHSPDPNDTILSVVYDGLVTYRRAGGTSGTTIVPDLAVSIPVPTDDGRTYTFTVRDGIRYSNGRVVSPRDVVATFERILTDRDSYGRVLLAGSELVGGDSCAPRDPDACDLSEGVVADEAAGTVTFHFVRPAPDFLRILATMHFAVLPSGTPLDLAGQPAPGTGAYMVAEVEGDSTVLERNPMFRQWSADAQPAGFADRIEVVAGVDPHEQIAMVERGEADFGLDGVPPDLFEELERRASDRLVRSPFYVLFAVTLNTASHPFDRLEARQAVAYALDRAELARMLPETTGLPLETPVTCQIIPPNIPGYAPDCPFTSPSDQPGSWAGPDLSRAQQLIERSGTAGAEVVFAMSPSLEEEIGRRITAMLRDLGYRAKFRTEPTELDILPEVPPDIDVTLLGWIQDYPSAAQFTVPLLSCPAPDGGPSVQGAGDVLLNLSNFCDPAMDRRMQRALDLQLTDPHASASAWEELDHDLVELAPMVPYATGVRLWLVSERASNVEVSPQLDVLISQIWVR